MFWNIYIGTIIFIFGLVLGSFYNVCIYRIPEGKSIINPPSHCGNCNQVLAPLDLIPVLSWVMLGRKCRYCKSPISYRYPLIELLTGFLFLLSYIKYSISWDLLFVLIFISIMIIITFIDIDHRIIPDRFIVIGLILSILYMFEPIWMTVIKIITIKNNFSFTMLFNLFKAFPWQNAVIGALVGAGCMLLVDVLGRVFYKKEGMGFGDVKLMLFAGLFLGLQKTIVALLFSIWIGAIAGIIILRMRNKHKHKDNEENIVKNKNENLVEESEDENIAEESEYENVDDENEDHYMPFGPFLAAGCIFSIFFGEAIFRWYFTLFK